VFEVTHAEMLECVRREIRLRERVYPRWVSQGKITQKLADEELTRMRSVLGFLVTHEPADV
jgi:hypothetical protein